MALREKNAGFKGMKIRAWRPNPLDDAEACRVIRKAVGPDFAIMFDRTAAAPQSVGQKVSDYETGLSVSRALEKHGQLAGRAVCARITSRMRGWREVWIFR